MKFCSLILCSMVLAACTSRSVELPKKGPNILLIMTDDQGYGDIGFNGNHLIRTPVMDSLARRGTRIDPFYVSPVCAPTRSSLMTGRYHLRTGVYDTYNGGAMMDPGEVTVAEILSAYGYHTGMIGKWHLGDNYPMRPMEQGFQYSLMHHGGGIGQPGDDFGNYIRGDSAYFDPYLWENGQRIRKKGYCSDIFTDQAIRFMEEHRREHPDAPFFLYLAFNAPHTPLQLPEEYLVEYGNLLLQPSDFEVSGENLSSMGPSDQEDARRVYGMVSNIDDNLGRLWNALKKLGLEEETLVVFLTDNGPQQRRFTAGLRNRKGSVYEGGIRVPCVWYWKGVIPEHSLVREPAAHIDVLPTLLDFAGVPYSGPVDGRSLRAELLGEVSAGKDRPLFFVWQRGFPQRYVNMTVRQGRYKLVGQQPYEASDTLLELFDLMEDPMELNNLSSPEPAIRDSLKHALDLWYEEVMASPHLVHPPRIVVGAPEENPVILGRNDWKGPTARRWDAPEAYGTWAIRVMDQGPYRVKMVFRDPLPGNGRAVVQSGSRQYWIRQLEPGAHEIVLKEIVLNPGEQSLGGWWEYNGQLYTPFYIEIDKI